MRLDLIRPQWLLLALRALQTKLIIDVVANCTHQPKGLAYR
jgi:hypothetical protein